MLKKKLKIIIPLICLLFIVILVLVLKNKSIKIENKESALKFKEEYENVNSSSGAVKVTIPEKNPIAYINYDELEQKINNKENFIIYFGFPTCPWCRNIVPILLETANKNNKIVNYVNVRALKSENVDEYNKIYELLYDYLEENSDGEKVLYVPDVYFFKDGNIIGHHLGSIESQTNPNIELDNNQKIELIDIYQELIDKIN